MQDLLCWVDLQVLVKHQRWEWSVNSLDLKFLRWMLVIAAAGWPFSLEFRHCQRTRASIIGLLLAKQSKLKTRQIQQYKLLEVKISKKVWLLWMKLMVLVVEIEVEYQPWFKLSKIPRPRLFVSATTDNLKNSCL